jgi:RNA polymerase sigma-70 factor, ECF subfamily
MNESKVAEAEVERGQIEPNDFDWIVSRHQKQIFRTLLFLVRDSDAAESLTQECFVRAFRMRAGFRGESSLATWLIRIAINLAYDHNRNRRWAFWRNLTRTDRIDAIYAMDPQRSQEQALIDTELVRAVHSAVDVLPERQRTAFLLRFVEDMPLETIADVMGLEVGTIKSHLHRAVDAVKRACGKHRSQDQ